MTSKIECLFQYKSLLTLKLFGYFRPISAVFDHMISAKRHFKMYFRLWQYLVLSVNIFRNFRKHKRSSKDKSLDWGKIEGKLAVENFTQNYSFMRFRWRDVGNLAQALCNALLIRFMLVVDLHCQSVSSFII